MKTTSVKAVLWEITHGNKQKVNEISLETQGGIREKRDGAWWAEAWGQFP